MVISHLRSFTSAQFGFLFTKHITWLLVIVCSLSECAWIATNGCYLKDKIHTIVCECILFYPSLLLSSFHIFLAICIKHTLFAIKIHSFKRYNSLSHNESKSIQIAKPEEEEEQQHMTYMCTTLGEYEWAGIRSKMRENNFNWSMISFILNYRTFVVNMLCLYYVILFGVYFVPATLEFCPSLYSMAW